MKYVEYHSNNSGGQWWLSDEDWLSLAKAGWHVRWASLREGESLVNFGLTIDDKGLTRYMGALATEAWLETDSISEAISSFNTHTSCNAASLGCYSCCGSPHSFTLREGDTPEEQYSGQYVDSWSPSAPEYGEADW